MIIIPQSGETKYFICVQCMQLFVHWIVPSISHAHIYAVLLKDHLYVFKQPKAKRGQRDKKKMKL